MLNIHAMLLRGLTGTAFLVQMTRLFLKRQPILALRCLGARGCDRRRQKESEQG